MSVTQRPPLMQSDCMPAAPQICTQFVPLMGIPPAGRHAFAVGLTGTQEWATAGLLALTGCVRSSGRFGQFCVTMLQLSAGEQAPPLFCAVASEAGSWLQYATVPFWVAQ